MITFNTRLETYYRENYKKLCNKVNRRAGGGHNAEDVVQNACINALTYQASFNPDDSSFEQWFGKILDNCLKKYNKDNRLSGMVDEDHEMAGIEAPPPSPYDDRMYQEVSDRIQKKPKPTAYILDLHFLKQYKPKEIKELVEESNGAIRNIIYRFKNELKEVYG